LQRLQKNFNLDFLDNKIAEEQEKQKQAAASQSSGPAKRAPGSATGQSRSSGRGDAANSRASGRAKASDTITGDVVPSARGADPDDFAIGDDSNDISRVTTPMPRTDPHEPSESTQSGEPSEKMDAKIEKDSAGVQKSLEKPAEDELPLAVRQKLAKLDTLSTKFQGT
jgi:hypothetical protein